MLKRILDKTFIKFVIVGVANTLFGTMIMYVLYNCMHASYWISSAANYFFGSILSYFLNKHFTFKYKKRDPKVIIRFVINIVVCYILAYGIAKPLAAYMLSGYTISLQENIAMAVGLCLFTAFNYLGQRFFAFKQQNTD